MDAETEVLPTYFRLGLRLRLALASDAFEGAEDIYTHTYTHSLSLEI